jgi:hypothetical protein
MSKEKENETPKPQKKKSFTFIYLVLIGIGFALPTVSFIFFTGMIPTMVMYVVERRKPRYLTYCVGSFNFAGTLPFMLTAIFENQTFSHALESLASPLPWLVMYGSSSIGLAFYSGIPGIVKITRFVQLKNQIEFAEKQRAKILVDWGEKIKDKHE